MPAAFQLNHHVHHIHVRVRASKHHHSALHNHVKRVIGD
jgi:hypothetical protein